MRKPIRLLRAMGAEDVLRFAADAEGVAEFTTTKCPVAGSGDVLDVRAAMPTRVRVGMGADVAVGHESPSSFRHRWQVTIFGSFQVTRICRRLSLRRVMPHAVFVPLSLLAAKCSTVVGLSPVVHCPKTILAMCVLYTD